MAKIMLVEDDVNLSEIYRARLEAEGYQVISAGDGEEALALAVKEHPDLIICDVMMPKISGFEMLDILRGTPGIQNSKVIMMTALSQAEDKARATALGADRYLVKSQVTLEDVVQTTKDVLGNSPTGQPTPPANVAPAAPPKIDNIPVTSPSPTTDSTPTPPSPAPTTVDPVVQTPIASQPASTAIPVVDQSIGQSTASETSNVNQQVENFVDKLPSAPEPRPATDGIDIPGKKVIQPLNDPTAKPDLDLLVAQEQQKELEYTSAQPTVVDVSQPPVESSGYLQTVGFMPGQANPNNTSGTVDPNNISI
ncbi:MAG TPA: response regulator [Candidatus Binatia bacterium]|nr:response regulator [Candidatus Binatia bacterium]